MPALLKSRLLWALAVPVAFVGLYALFGYQLAPGLLRHQAQKFVRENYGRALAIGEIRIQPFTLQVEVRDLALPDADGQPMLGFERLVVDFEIASLWNRTFTFREITIDAPQVRAVIRPDGTMNLADLASPADPAQADAPPPRVWVHKLGVGRGQVAYVDQARRKPFEHQFRDVDFDVADFRTTPEGGDFHFSARNTDQATFEWKGRLALAPALASQGKFKVGGLRIPGLLDFIGDDRPFNSTTGAIDVAGSYRVALAQQFELDVDIPTVHVRDLSLLAPGAEAAWLSIPSVKASGLKASMPAQAVTIDRLAVDALQAQAWLNPDRSVNLAALFAAPASTAPAPDGAPGPAPSTVASRPWTVRVGGIEFTDAAIDFEDRAIAPGTRFKIAPVNLRLSDASLDLSKPLQVAVDAVINDQARFEVKGTLTPAPLAASVDIRLDKVPMTTLQPYVLPVAALTITDGQLDVAGKVDLAPGGHETPEISFAGEVAIDRFKSIDNALKQDFVNFAKLEIGKVRYAMAPDSLSVDRVVVSEPYARVIISADRQTNIAAVLNPKNAAKPPDQPRAADAPKDAPPATVKHAAGKADTLPIRIREFRVDRMRMNFTDNLIQPSFSADVQELSGTIASVSSASDARTKVNLKGRLGEFSPVSIEGELQPFAFDRYTDMKLRFENIPLPIFNPYSGPLAGYSIAKGQLTTGLHYVISDRKLDAEHKIRIQQLEWGEATPSKGEATVPVKFATALLKDRNGLIDLDVPVGGTLDDPTFRIGPVVWQIIGNIVSKAVTAPFALLGSLFEGAEQSQFADFAPGSAALDPTLAGRLAALGKGLVERPELTLDVPIGTVTALDMPALVDRAFEAALAAAVKARFGATAPAYVSLEPARKVEVLNALLTARTGVVPQAAPVAAQPPAQSAPPAGAGRVEAAAPNPAAAVDALEQALRAAVTVPESDLATLGEQRALALSRALLTDTGLDPARVFRVRGGKVNANEGQVRLELALR